MKVIILGTAWPYRGGLSAFNERLAYEYIENGHDVEIVTFTLQYPSLLFPGKSQYSSESAPRGVKITRMLNAINPFSWLRTGKYIKRQRPDLLITKFWLPFMAPALGMTNRIAKQAATCRVSILDNLVPHEKRVGDKFFARYFVNSIDGMVAMSQSVLADADMFDPRRSKPRLFCPHPLYDHYGSALSRDEALRLLNLESDNRYILFFGFIRDYKGLDLLLDAMADPRIAQLGIKLIVAGEFYGDATPYMQQIDRLGIANRVVLHTEFIPDHEVNRYLCAADVVVQPYKSATQSGVTQIAFNFDKPMIVTNVGGLPEIVPDGRVGFVVSPQSDAISDAIVRFYGENWVERLTKGVREEKKKYAWSNMTDALKKVMQQTKFSKHE
ncbi:MAG: glycosyltransferase [Bacteroidales bacterium]|nr:glycosyltransferase [Bacteroidales bacterium]